MTANAQSKLVEHENKFLEATKNPQKFKKIYFIAKKLYGLSLVRTYSSQFSALHFNCGEDSPIEITFQKGWLGYTITRLWPTYRNHLAYIMFKKKKKKQVSRMGKALMEISKWPKPPPQLPTFHSV